MDYDRQVLPEENHSVLEIAHSYLLNSVAAKANEIDSDPNTLMQALQELGDLDLLALRIPHDWGGKGVSEDTFSKFQELVARYSGALAFLQTQHQSAAAMLVASSNISLKQEYLPRISKGEVLLGIGFSQLRRVGEPLTLAKPVSGGYQLDGVVPWVTGWGIFDDFIIAATLPDGCAVFGVVPFRETYQNSESKITLTSPAQLAAMTSTNTVTANLSNYFLPQEYVVSMKPAGWIHENDKNNVLRATFLATGCAFAGLDIIESVVYTKSLPAIAHALTAFQQELNQCRTEIRQTQKNTHAQLSEKLQLRAWAIDLATRIAHAAVTVSSGAANYLHHPAQRVYREALVFTVTGQTNAVMEATLERLSRGWGNGGQGGENSYLFSQSKVIQPKSITYSRVIHLSHVIDTDIPQWEGDPLVEFETVAEIEKDGYFLRRFSLGEHSATHINASKSFYYAGVGIDQYPAESLVVPAVVINIQEQVKINSDYTFNVADILEWEEQYGKITSKTVVLLYTGWQEKWCDRTAFMNPDSQGNMHFPAFGSDATEFLLNERHIAGVGIDTHGVDSGQDTTFTTNCLVLEKPRIVLENLTNLDQLPPKGVTLVIGILRLRDGSGSPAGVMALIN
ncbi:MAG: cyclase family protein [Pelatocladus maniniholoensis HA4357-MV3]|jgi:kynurenine formamidase/alkylation response protein AidB-like acyl-CoA dehydrogenase|uniref:Cyclase family protein n=1 Tax=Pelatocladus maniniholoensis HA4357-MV3 TaxID=1117104 RepID=A0A9E3H981_9NOST|nr:cyclase family protein [Pelatocladus maniniholoensis HA4357-MV3]BAZ68183.1 acyl-CoA dehydrogenase domain protein [Fischerella sp. NIES-4106]